MGLLTTYRSHKTVQAAKITGIKPTGDAGLLFIDDEQKVHCSVSKEWLDKHQPAVGGYFVRYEDGYESFSPADAFEAGYTRV